MSLSILCISKLEAFALPFIMEMSRLAAVLDAQLVLAADGPEAFAQATTMSYHRLPTIVGVQSQGYLESVHDMALQNCRGQFVLRLDDDERCSRAMVKWLQLEAYKAYEHWKFPRAHLFRDEQTVLMHPQLWPDHQTRLSLFSLAGGRSWIHAGSPFGGGTEAPVVLEHHKFLVKSVEERQAIAARYDQIQPGSGTGGMLAFNLPELCGVELRTAPLGEGIAMEVGR